MEKNEEGYMKVDDIMRCPRNLQNKLESQKLKKQLGLFQKDAKWKVISKLLNNYEAQLKCPIRK